MINENRQLSQLPEGWVWTRLGEVASLNPKFTDDVPDQLEVSFIPMKCLEELTGQVDLSLTKRYSEVKKGYTAFRNGDVIFAKITPCMENGKVGIVNNLKNGIGFGSTEFHVVRLFDGQMPNRLVFFFLVRESFRRDARMHMTGSAGQLRVPKGYLEEVSFPLPPLPEQHRIVAKIEELFTRLDAGEEALKKVKAQLKQYHQAVLKYAFQGKLTEEWREAHKGQMESASVLLGRMKEERNKNAKGKYQELPSLDMSNLPELPEGWVWTRLGEVGEINSGYGFPKKYQGRKKGEIPFFKVMDISKAFLNHSIYLKDADNYISVKERDEIKAEILKAGTTVFAKIGEAIKLNRRAILSQDSLVDNNVMGIYPFPGLIDVQFIFHLLLTIKLGDFSRATTVPSVRKSDIEQIPVPFPPLPEQRKIVEEIERCFSVADEIEKDVGQSLKQAERLRQSILKRAFEGKLVPQNPTDEPAEKLLEHIRAERARIEAEKKATGKTRRS